MNQRKNNKASTSVCLVLDVAGVLIWDLSSRNNIMRWTWTIPCTSFLFHQHCLPFLVPPLPDTFLKSYNTELKIVFRFLTISQINLNVTVPSKWKCKLDGVSSLDSLEAWLDSRDSSLEGIVKPKHSCYSYWIQFWEKRFISWGIKLQYI